MEPYQTTPRIRFNLILAKFVSTKSHDQVVKTLQKSG